MAHQEVNEARERVLDVSEHLFMEGGYTAVKLKHIAQQLAMKESSLYYHFPNGKEELYVSVMRRNFARHQEGVGAAIAGAGDNWVAQLRAVAYWLLSQPTLDVIRMHKSDLPAIDVKYTQELNDAAYLALNLPIKHIFDRALERGEAVAADTDLIAGIFISMISSIDIIRTEWNPKSKQEMADTLIESWVKGLQPR